MDYFKIAYTALGGLGIFFLGMKFLSEGLQSIAGNFVKKLISTVTSNRVIAVVVGLIVTTIVQSSSITTVMVVGLVNAGLMDLMQAIGVILGANIGTTITGWILAIKIGKYGLLLIGLGIFPMLFSRNETIAALGKGLLALGMIFFGLQLMSGAFKPLRTDPDFISMLHYFDARNLASVLGCVVVGCLLTFIIQSSSAMLGITIALASTGTITFHTAAALVLGENIGTTITAQLASIGGTTTAKRAAASHAIFNVVGVAIMIAIFEPFVGFVDSMLPSDPEFIDVDGSKPNIAAHIALGHSLFNVVAVLVMLPFIQYLAKLVETLRPESPQAKKYRLQYINTPGTMSTGVGLQMANLEIKNMARIAEKAFRRTRRYLKTGDERFFDGVQYLEGVTDNIQEEMTTFICNLMQGTMSSSDATRAYALVRASDELESIVDYCSSLCSYRKRLIKNKMDFGEEAWNDLNFLTSATSSLYKGVYAKISENENLAEYPEVFEEATDLSNQADRIKHQHLDRLRAGSCKPLPALTFSDMVVSLRKIKNHTLNLAEALSYEQSS